MGYRLGRRGGGGRGIVAMAGLAALLIANPSCERPAPPGSPTERGSPTAAGRRVSAVVTDVVDGDTIEVSIGGRSEHVRYIGVDTPETVAPDEAVQCFGPQASAFNHRFVDGARVTLGFDAEHRDKYGRLLAYVYRGRRFVNAILVRRGLARTLTIPPNDSFAPLFGRLAAAAGRRGRGLWGACAA